MLLLLDGRERIGAKEARRSRDGGWGWGWVDGLPVWEMWDEGRREMGARLLLLVAREAVDRGRRLLLLRGMLVLECFRLGLVSVMRSGVPTMIH